MRSFATPSSHHVHVTGRNQMLIDALQIPPELLHPVRECKELGHGTFGTCSKVTLHGTSVCAKTFHTSDTSMDRVKLAIAHEAIMLLKVRHQNISFLLGIQTVKQPYQLISVLYSVDGVSISVHDTFSFVTLSGNKGHVLSSVRPTLTLPVWLHMMKNLAEALLFIHGKSIVHCDIKSDNVVLHKKDETNIDCVLIDFGKSNYITKVKRYRLSQQEQEDYMHSHKHIAPDLVDGTSAVSPASDVYSYGRLLKNIIKFFPLSMAIHPTLKHTIKQCLKHTDSERPTTEFIIKIFHDINV